MFGLSLGEIMVLLIVGIVVIGPRNLPTMMRTVGKWVSKLRRMSTDLRSQSGIDDLIRHEGLEREIHELRSLSRMNVVDTFIAPAIAATAPASQASVPEANRLSPPAASFQRVEPLREREYPLIGCDAYDAVADDAVPYPPPAAEPTIAELAGDRADAEPRDDAAPAAAAAPAADARGAEGTAS